MGRYLGQAWATRGLEHHTHRSQHAQEVVRRNYPGEKMILRFLPVGLSRQDFLYLIAYRRVRVGHFFDSHLYRFLRNKIGVRNM